jgi:hypothetical protein
VRADARHTADHHARDPPPSVEDNGRAEAVDRPDVRFRTFARPLPFVHRQALEQPPRRLGLQDVPHQRRLPRAGQSGHDDELPLRDVDVEITQVVRRGAADAHAIRRSGFAPRLRPWRDRREIAPRFDKSRRPFAHQRPAVRTGPRADLDDVVGGCDDVLLMLDDEDGRAAGREPVQRVEQPVDVVRMQTDRRLVQDEQVALLDACEVAREPDALRLAARERR